jgi:cytosine deaminase
MDLLIRNARLADRASDAPVDIGVGNGRIVAIARGLVADAQVYDAEERLVCPGLVESHIHLDKSRIIDRCAPQERATLSPVKGVTPLKASMTVEDVYKRAAQTLEQCIVHGTTRVRTQVEVDPGIGMRGFDAVQALIAEYKWAVDIEMCVFPQEGLTNYPGTDELLVEGLKRGAKAIGAAPNYDPDHAGQIHRVFDLAREFDVDIDMHLDSGNSPDEMDIYLVCELAEKYRLGGRVAVGHMCKLSTMPLAGLHALARRIADAGVAVTVLPATELFMMGRDQDHSVRKDHASKVSAMVADWFRSRNMETKMRNAENVLEMNEIRELNIEELDTVAGGMNFYGMNCSVNQNNAIGAVVGALESIPIVGGVLGAIGTAIGRGLCS